MDGLMLCDLPARQRLRRYHQIERLLRHYGYDPCLVYISGYVETDGTITWWTGDDEEGPTNYIHRDGRSEFYGAIEDQGGEL